MLKHLHKILFYPYFFLFCNLLNINELQTFFIFIVILLLKYLVISNILYTFALSK